MIVVWGGLGRQIQNNSSMIVVSAHSSSSSRHALLQALLAEDTKSQRGHTLTESNGSADEAAQVVDNEPEDQKLHMMP